jgi:hypothetical protein
MKIRGLYIYLIFILIFFILIFFNLDYYFTFLTYFPISLIAFPIKPVKTYTDLTKAYTDSDPNLKKYLYKKGGVYGIIHNSKKKNKFNAIYGI